MPKKPNKVWIWPRVALACALLASAPASLRAERLPIRVYSSSEGLAAAYVIRIVRDSRGFLWICTRGGLSRFDGHRFKTYGVEHGLPASTINHLLETRGGAYWVATNGGGVCRFDAQATRAGSAG